MTDEKWTSRMADFEPPPAPEGGPQIEMGGQAVIEGVMMRSSRGYAVAVRKSNGDIKVRKTPFTPITRRIKPLGWPFFRGAIGLFEMLVIGFKTLNYSVEEWEEDYEEEERRKKAAGKVQDSEAPGDGVVGDAVEISKTEEQPASALSNSESPEEKKESKAKGQLATFAMFAFSFTLAIALMVVVPNLLTSGLGYLPWIKDNAATHGAPALDAAPRPSESSGLVEEQRPFLYNIISGSIRALIIFGYVFAISFLEDVKRLFQYHGAEHKAVSAYEHGKPMVVSEVQPFSRLHPRCGTTFIFVVVVVSIIFFAAVAWALQALIPDFTTWHFVKKKALIIFAHLMFMPLVAGTSYELLKLSAKFRRTLPAQLIVLPGFAFQKITTNEPDDEHVEVSIAALQAALDIGDKEDTFIIPAPGMAKESAPTPEPATA